MKSTVAAAFLCDAAVIREGVGNVLGAGINILARTRPITIGADLFVLLELARDEAELVVTVEARTLDGEILNEIGGSLYPSGAPVVEDLLPTLVPAVLPVSGILLPAAGVYELHTVLAHPDGAEIDRKVFGFAVHDVTGETAGEGND